MNKESAEGLVMAGVILIVMAAIIFAIKPGSGGEIVFFGSGGFLFLLGAGSLFGRKKEPVCIIKLPALSGWRLICGHARFKRAEPFFSDKGFIQPSWETPSTMLHVYRKQGHGTFFKTFSEFPGDWPDKALTQDQIIVAWDTGLAGENAAFLIRKPEALIIGEDNPEEVFMVVVVHAGEEGAEVVWHHLTATWIYGKKNPLSFIVPIVPQK